MTVGRARELLSRWNAEGPGGLAEHRAAKNGGKRTLTAEQEAVREIAAGVAPRRPPVTASLHVAASFAATRSAIDPRKGPRSRATLRMTRENGSRCRASRTRTDGRGCGHRSPGDRPSKSPTIPTRPGWIAGNPPSPPSPCIRQPLRRGRGPPPLPWRSGSPSDLPPSGSPARSPASAPPCRRPQAARIYLSARPKTRSDGLGGHPPPALDHVPAGRGYGGREAGYRGWVKVYAGTWVAPLADSLDTLRGPDMPWKPIP